VTQAFGNDREEGESKGARTQCDCARNRAAEQRLYSAYASTGQAQSTGNPHREVRNPYILQRVLPLLPKDRSVRILDLGCGNGNVLSAAVSMGWSNVAGCDLSLEQVDGAHALGRDYVEYAAIPDFLSRQDDRSVDVIICKDILEHFALFELVEVMESTARVLRTNGKFIGHVPNGDGLTGGGIRYGDLTHHRAFTRRSLEQLTRLVGYSSLELYEDSPVVHGPASLFRRVCYEILTLPLRALSLAETGSWGYVASRNLLFRAVKA
jgi:2-polyprenyl-3-methyl-5-hydroxy-6-metoxy-1,4-benzoquinol methylase